MKNKYSGNSEVIINPNGSIKENAFINAFSIHDELNEKIHIQYGHTSGTPDKSKEVKAYSIGFKAGVKWAQEELIRQTITFSISHSKK